MAGFSAWKNNFERNVMKGQKGIKIIAPSPYKIKQEMQKIDPHTQKPVIGKDGKPVTEEKEVTIPAYKVVSVFDVSQTEGKELPDIAIDELPGDVDRYKDFFAALEKTSTVPIAFENIEGGSHGYYHLEDKRIAINEGMSELQTLKTAIHEIAHAKLHDIDLNAPKDEQQPHIDRRTREVEAESVAYTVCQHYGLDTSDYSFGYVAGWSSGRELSELKSSLETIRSAAAEIINSIDANFAELQKAQDKEQTAGQEQPTREGQEAAPQPEAPKKADTAGKEKPEAAPKEAFTPETIYRVRRNPYSDSRENSHLLQAYAPDTDKTKATGDRYRPGCRPENISLRAAPRQPPARKIGSDRRKRTAIFPLSCLQKKRNSSISRTVTLFSTRKSIKPSCPHIRLPESVRLTRTTAAAREI